MVKLLTIMRRYLLLIALAIVAVSCKKSEVSALVFDESVKSLVFDVEGETKSITFTTTMNWNAEVSDEWIEVDPMSGLAGENLNINITVAKNDSSTARNGYVRIVLSNGKDEKVELKQNGQAIEVDTSTIPNDEIWYTNGSTTEATELQSSIAFGVEVLSHSYDSSKERWVIKFSAPIDIIVDDAFNWCENVTSITIPNSVKELGKRSFAYCFNLANISIPNSVIYIGEGAFECCYNLKEIDIPNGVTKIHDSTFFRCTSLMNVTIPDSVLIIEDNAFCECTHLKDLVIPDNVFLIDNYAFACCERLLSITIPDSVTIIGAGVFAKCRMLKEFKGKFASEDGRCLIVDGMLKAFTPADLIEYTIPNGVTRIGESVFEDCVDLRSVTIPNDVISIGDRAFAYCTNLPNIFIPNNVTSIGAWTFAYCTNIVDVTISNSVTNIQDGAFYGCYSLDDVFVSDIAAWCGTDFANLDANPLYNGCNLYVNNELVTDLTIPNGVTEIGNMAFSGCLSIANVTIPDSVVSIGEGVFYGCSSLVNVSIPKSVTEIGNYTFCNCSSLVNVSIPESVIVLREDLFSGCSSLESVSIPDGVTTIADGVFNGCHSLASVLIPNTVSEIGNWAFRDCVSITSVTIPDRVAYIGWSAFSGCSNLLSVYCEAETPPTTGFGLFDYNADDREIYVPMESVEAYKSAEGWSDYADAIEGYDF